ncbi:hypothetical protein SUGI_0229370 [Cryptomeria japonica]|nr:hypothetical protein SUGI_0229370 [Cryptomeria japonica]
MISRVFPFVVQVHMSRHSNSRRCTKRHYTNKRLNNMVLERLGHEVIEIDDSKGNVASIASVEESLVYFSRRLKVLVDKYLEVNPQPKTVEVQSVFSLFLSEEVTKVALPYISFFLRTELVPISNCTMVVTAAWLAALGKNSSSSADDIKGILKSIGVDCDDERIEIMLGQLKQKSLAAGIALTFYEEEVYILTEQVTHAQDPLFPVDELKQVLAVSVTGQGGDFIPGYGIMGKYVPAVGQAIYNSDLTLRRLIRSVHE